MTHELADQIATLRDLAKQAVSTYRVIALLTAGGPSDASLQRLLSAWMEAMLEALAAAEKLTRLCGRTTANAVEVEAAEVTAVARSLALLTLTPLKSAIAVFSERYGANPAVVRTVEELRAKLGALCAGTPDSVSVVKDQKRCLMEAIAGIVLYGTRGDPVPSETARPAYLAIMQEAQA
jgi:hypothetical protein